MQEILEVLKNTGEFKSICEGFWKKNRHQLLTGLSGSQKAFLTAAIIQHKGAPALYLTSGEQEATRLVEDLSCLLPGVPVFYFPTLHVLPFQVLAAGREVMASRLKVLQALTGGEPVVVVTTLEGFMRRLSSPVAFSRHRLKAAVGSSVKPEELIRKLLDMGYERADLVEGHGQFSMRGGIMDIYPVTADNPVRVEFFGDEVDSIRTFDVDTQRSHDMQKELEIYPATELVVDDQSRSRALERLQSNYQTQMKKLNRAGAIQARQNLSRTYQEVMDRIREGSHFPGMEQFLPYFYEEKITLADYFPPDSLALIDEPLRLKEAMGALYKERVELYTDLIERGRVLPGQFDAFIQDDELEKSFKTFWCIYLSFMPRQSYYVRPDNEVSFPVKGIPAFLGRMDILSGEVAQWKKTGYAVVILAGGREKAAHLLQAMRDSGVEAYLQKAPGAGLVQGTVRIMTGSLSGGFEMPTARLVVITASEMYGRQRRVGKAGTRSRSRLEPFTDLKKGDHVVHVNHGIGRYLGIETLEIGAIQKDYLAIKYAGEDKLFVPTDQVGLIQKYLGSEGGEGPKLSRLGGAEWNRVKGRVKEAVKEMAQELLKLYAARETIGGHAFGPDTVWQKELEEAFPYEETPDQLKAIDDVKKDMQRLLPMDRLLCGDVGYGKTEVALRAAFKAIMDGKQVAVLVPTTILAQQHFNTFRERFSSYPIGIEMLSRFRSPGEQKKILHDLERGKLDLVIGTHRLVQEDVRFNNLGLLVVDEEQRFGVSHKEKLKIFKNNIDVLTLTATPIPRTLHMSLVGVRDTSILETPPENRFPVQTYVLEEEPSIIREAICREIGRGGQVFFVHNRIMDLDLIASWLSGLVPDARLVVAHGQLKEDELENIMLDFLDGAYDVLVCTTIIESGLDIPNVNTLIVKDADNLGLAQLYQLRGRVGRSNRIAYAYFTYRQDRIMNEVAEKRLSAIKEFTDFGSGYKIAMRDLEIRGAGNLLGAEQHGHIAAVGFDLYCRMLEEAVQDARGETREAPIETSVELPVEAFIPDEYIPDTDQKVEIYRRIAGFRDETLLDDLAGELVDRFGDEPAPVTRLLKVARLKVMAGKSRIKNIAVNNGYFRLQFARGHQLTGEKLVKIGQQYRNRVKFSNQEEGFEIRLRAPSSETTPDYFMGVLESFLAEISGEI